MIEKNTNTIDAWVSISMLWLKPWCPGFVRMYFEGVDEALSEVILEAMEDIIDDKRTLGQAFIGDIVEGMMLEYPVDMEFYRLVGGSRRIDRLHPKHQRAKMIGTVDAWHGAQKEKLRRAKERKRSAKKGAARAKARGKAKAKPKSMAIKDKSDGSEDPSDSDSESSSVSDSSSSAELSPSHHSSSSSSSPVVTPREDPLEVLKKFATERENRPRATPGGRGKGKDHDTSSSSSSSSKSSSSVDHPSSSGPGESDNTSGIIDGSGSDGDGDGDRVVVPRAPRVPRQQVTIEWAPDFLISVRVIGELPDNVSALQIACPCHGSLCLRQRTVIRGPKKGSGRPLGYLFAWVIKAMDRTKYPTCAAHKCKTCQPTLQERQAARRILYYKDDADLILPFEKDIGIGHGPDSEPIVFSL